MLLKKRATYQFAGFRLDGRERLLLLEGTPVSITPKVLDALLLLVENAGNLVEKTTLRERLWPGQIVEDGTLARVIADLRKALGDVSDQRRFIETVPKFGYRFVGELSPVESQESLELQEPVEPREGLQPGNSGFRVANGKWIAAIAVLVTLAGSGFLIERFRTRPPAIQSLLIAPFQTIGDAPDAEMLRLGLQESLTMELSGLSKLAVIELKQRDASAIDDAAEIGRRHRAGFVLVGTIQLTPDRIRVNARLLRSASGEAIWVRSFDESRDDVFKVESRLAKLTVAELIPALPASENEQMTRRLPTNASAYRYYLVGRHYWNERDENAYIQAIDNFKKSAAADPEYAPAYVGLADSYLLAARSWHNPRTETLPLAEAAIHKAIQIDPSLGQAHATLALIAGNYYFDWDKAERELQTSLRLSPNYVTAHHWYAEFLTMQGKFDQSEAEFEVARNLDPASPIVLTDLAQLYNFERQYQRSLQTLDEALKLDPSFHLAHDRKAYALMLMRRPEDALREFETADREAGRSWIGKKAWAAAVEGHRQEAIEFAMKAEQEEPDDFMLGMVWAEIGDSTRAMDWLQRAYDRRSGGLVSLKVNPVFDRLRSYARFQALLRQMRLM